MASKNTTFTLTGVKEIQRAYRELPKRLAGKVIRQEIRKALKPMAERVKELTPRRTGALADVTKVKARAKKKRGVIALDIVQGEGSFKGATFYGGFQNFGTKKMKGKHFFERAFDEMKDAATAQVAAGIAAGIDRELAALASGGSAKAKGGSSRASGGAAGGPSGASPKVSVPRARDVHGRFIKGG
jgi:HK97 gp10 family phage protein